MLKFFAKLQMDQEPGIRTNTTICLAKIASYLTPATRKKVLVAAFCRSLRDPFPKARVAGLMSFMATQSYYSKEECAEKIIPSLSLLTIDPELETREAAFKTIKQFIQKLEKISQTGEEEDQDKAPMNESVLTWAFSSISKKIYGGETATSTTPTTPTQQRITQSSEITGPSTPNAKLQKSISAEKSNFEKWEDFDDFEEQPVAEKPQKGSTIQKEEDDEDNDLDEEKNTDGWDNDFDDFDDFPVQTPSAKPSKLEQKKAAVQKKINTLG